ncbi:hypothetical protein, partial [Gardnerella vaginalis]|uniref:hypothetical protein n=1 Tax=Gardnerella vaginalis TaxID=2702 RepID=UPI00197A7225
KKKQALVERWDGSFWEVSIAPPTHSQWDILMGQCSCVEHTKKKVNFAKFFVDISRKNGVSKRTQ